MGSGPERVRDDESPQTWSRLNQSFALKVAVGLQHGVRVDRQLADDLLGCGQLVAWLKQTELERLMDLVHKLEIGRDP